MGNRPAPLNAAAIAEPTTGGGAETRAPGVEANARLTGITGLLLLVMLAAEGVTIVSIHSLLSWHVAIGLALLPPVALKLGSTMWRFGRYYWGDIRYRQAGPPPLVLRVLGPIVVLTTVAVLATGIAAWATGPRVGPWTGLHKASFLMWFGAMAIHVLAHTPRALRLASADTERPSHRRAPHPEMRLGLVVLSAVAGIGLAFAAGGISSGWSSWPHHLH